MKTFVFRVVIDTEDDIFRDIELCENQNFEDLHEAIIHAYEFRGDQMASFYMSNDEWEKGKEIGLMDVSQYDGDTSTPSMANSILQKEIKEKNQKILYVYDFLRMWIFYVEVIAIREESKELTYPAIIREFGAAPDEESKEIPDLFGDLDLSPKGFDDDDDYDDNDYDDDDPFGDFEDSYDDEY